MDRVVKAFVLAILVIVFVGFSLWYRSSHRPTEEAYVGERRVILWSSTAQVRQSLATLHFGERVNVLGHYGEKLQVRTAQGLTGWLDAGQIIAPALWTRITGLTASAEQMPVQGRAHTRVLSNLHLEPGRATQRIGQLPRDAAVEILGRATAEQASGGEESGGDDKSAAPRREDWLLVRGRLPDSGELAGWVLGRFVQYDLPDPIPTYASSAGMRVIGWFELSQVRDPRAGDKPQYLVVGNKGAEGQVCDFNVLRVFTWGATRQRYETAYIEGNLCGRLPVRVTPASNPGGDAYFRFTNVATRGQEQLNYRMHQTIVRRVREPEKPASRPRSRPGS